MGCCRVFSSLFCSCEWLCIVFSLLIYIFFLKGSGSKTSSKKRSKRSVWCCSCWSHSVPVEHHEKYVYIKYPAYDVAYKIIRAANLSIDKQTTQSPPETQDRMSVLSS